MHTKGKKLVFNKYPGLRIGFTTQNFRLAVPVNATSLSEIIAYASAEGYHFIEIRDDNASLTTDECKLLADLARKLEIEVIYEIHKNPLDPAFGEVLDRGLNNAVLFPDPGVLRVLLSLSEFNAYPDKQGWTKDELERVIQITETSASAAKSKNVRLIVENVNEPFFGDGSVYYGLAEFFENTTLTGLQFDISNPFTVTARMRTEPEHVAGFLSQLGKRWVTTHLKTITGIGGKATPALADNPLPVSRVIELMGLQDIRYAALELSPVAEWQDCCLNHEKSIQFLRETGIIEK
ncbi:MAG: hypothetical protein WAV93_08370 [Bacteroidales bacterium]